MSCSRSPFSEEILISRVQAYPELYDVRHKDYKNSQRRTLIWMEIADGFLESDIDAEICAKKWKRCRDSYFRNKRELKMIKSSGQGASTKKPYKFSNLLRFLDDHNHKTPPSFWGSSLEFALGERLEAVDSETVRELLDEAYLQHSSGLEDQDAAGYDDDPGRLPPPLKEEIEEAQGDGETHSDRPLMASQGHFMTQMSSPASSSRSSFSPKFRRRFMPEPCAEPQPKRGMKTTYEEPRTDALGEIVASLQAQNDEDALFGLTIGTTLKRFPRVIKSKVKLEIMKLLFDAEVEMAGRS